jgi:hypothetical protein
MSSSRDLARSSRKCPRTRPAQSLSTRPPIRRTRSVVVLNVRVLIV